MKQKCDYCGNYIEDTEEVCPNCGGVNSHYQRESIGTPQTIEELKKWYTDHNLPPQEVTRFFIGVDYKEPKAFGIYQEGSRFIVYKNKADGSRAIRYDGGDEAYAVHELYLKLKEKISEQKAENASRKSAPASNQKQKKKRKKSGSLVSSIIIICIISIFIGCLFDVMKPDRGYYDYGGNQYYYLDNAWYIYDNTDDSWSPTYVDGELEDNPSDYYESSSYDTSLGTSDFEDTSYYSSWEETVDSDEWENDSWDSDSNWDSNDSWDSDGGDWDSDW